MTNNTSLTDNTAPTDRTPDTRDPYLLARDEGRHAHFLNHLATTKVTAGQAGTMTAIEFFAPRGFGPPLHVHDDEDEILVLLDGEMSFTSGEVDGVATTGGVAWLPHGRPHTFQVLSDTARFLSVTASTTGKPQFDRFVAALGTPTTEPTMPSPEEIDPGHVAEVCSAHGITVLGPPPAPLD